MSTAETTAPATYTEAEATDEALLLLIRRLRRQHPEAYLAVTRSLPDGAQETLDHAEHRADLVRVADSARGIRLGSRPFPAWLEELV
jgi:hypothetical protein